MALPEDKAKRWVREVSFPIQYSELARQFYSMWNMAIHSFNGDALSIPENAKDPEMTAYLQSENFLQRLLVAHLHIHHTLLHDEPGQPNGLIAYAAYNWFEVPINETFPQQHAENWEDMAGGVDTHSPKAAEIFGQ